MDKEAKTAKEKKPVVKKAEGPEHSRREEIKKEQPKVEVPKSGKAYRVLVKPIISEKATHHAADRKYTFEVATNANKVEIKKAVQEIYGVMPTDVNIINQRGKAVRFGRNYGVQKAVKKAIVTLKKGDNIKLYEGI